jgi:hypothetical protein
VEKHVARLRNTVNDIPGMSNVFPFNQFYFGTEQDEIISFFITSNFSMPEASSSETMLVRNIFHFL